jgi:nucleoid DNA-binding protein
MAGAAAAALGSSPVAAGGKPDKPTAKSRYYARLATEAGVSTSAVQAVFEHICKQVRDVMRNKGCFRLQNIASLSLTTCRARPGRIQKIQGRVFKSKPQPCTQRVRCSITKALEKSAVASTPPSQNSLKTSPSQTPAAKAQSQAIARSSGAADITSELVGKVLCALRKVIDRDLRTTGTSLIDGLAKLVLVDVKARSAQYVKLNGRTVLLKAKGPHRRVYGRVQ